MLHTPMPLVGYPTVKETVFPHTNVPDLVTKVTRDVTLALRLQGPGCFPCLLQARIFCRQYTLPD